MKILVLTTFYPEKKRSDLIQDTSVVQYFAKEWVAKGHEVVVLHLYAHNFKNIVNYKFKKYGKFQKLQMDGDIRVYLMENQFLIRNAKKYCRFQQKKITTEINRLLDSELKNFSPDALIVHFPSHFYGIVNKLNVNCKKIATFHITDINTTKANINIRNEISNTYDKLLARSHSIAREMKKIGLAADGIANSGIDKNMILSTNDIIDKKFKNKKIKLLYAGSFIERKNVDKIILALANKNISFEYECHIIGEGKNKKEYEKLVKEKGLEKKIIFEGKLSREKVFEFMKESDVFITISKNETLGLTYLEAMSQGCITIGSRNEGIDGIIIDGNNGYLIDAGDSNALASLLIKISMMNTRERQKIISEAIKTVSKMTSEKVAAKYIEYVK